MKKYFNHILIAVFCVGLGVVSFVKFDTLTTENTENNASYHSRDIADFSDLRNVLAVADNASVVRIKSQETRESIDGLFPLTIYKADVLYNIKGQLNGEVALSQNSGYLRSENENKLILAEGDLLKIGGVYAVMTSEYPYLSELEGYVVHSIHSNNNSVHYLELSEESNSEQNLLDMIRSNNTVQKLQDAYIHENKELRDWVKEAKDNYMSKSQQ